MEPPTRIYVTPNPQLRISTANAGDIEAEWVSGGALENYQIHIQTSLTAVLSYDSDDVDTTRSTSARLLVGANEDPSGLLDDIAALSSGDRIIWFLTEPERAPDVRLSASLDIAAYGASRARVEQPAPVQLAASLDLAAYGASRANVAQPTPVRLSASLQIEAYGSTRVQVVQPTPVRLSASLDFTAYGMSAVHVERAPPVRLAAAFELTAYGASRVNVVQPAAVRLVAALDLAAYGSSRAQVVQPAPVRLSAALDLAAYGSSRVQVGVPGSVLLVASLDFEAYGSSRAQVVQPAPVRLAATLDLAAYGASRANVAQPTPVRLAASLDLAAYGSSRVQVVQPLTLADIAIPSGRILVGTGSLIAVGASGDVYNPDDATIVDGADPPNLGDNSLNATRIYVTGNPQLRISEDGTGDIQAIFSAGGALENYQIHVQTSPTDVLSYDRDDIDSGRSRPARLLLGAEGDPQDLLAPVSALSQGDRVIWFLTEPTPADAVRLSASLDIAAYGASRVQVAQPAAVRLSASVDLEAYGSSRVQVVQPTPVQLAASLLLAAYGSSRVDVAAPVRLAAALEFAAYGSSRVQVAVPGSVLLVASLDFAAYGSSRVDVVQPASVRLAASLDVAAYGSSRGAVVPLGSSVQWSDGAQNPTITQPVLLWSRRRVEGAPDVGDHVPDLWTQPVVLSRLGRDGAGFENIYAALATNTLPVSAYPDNAWGYDEPQTVNGVQWSDDIPDLSDVLPFLFHARRPILGTPIVGATVPGDWEVPRLVAHYGEDGADGVGFEYVYTTYSSENLPLNRRPLNTWGYDSPETVNGQVWLDGAPETSVANPVTPHLPASRDRDSGRGGCHRGPVVGARGADAAGCRRGRLRVHLHHLLRGRRSRRPSAPSTHGATSNPPR